MIRNLRFGLGNFLMKSIKGGSLLLYLSDLTVRELEIAPKQVRDFHDSLSEDTVESTTLTVEAENLAKLYIKERVVTDNHLVDAQHIAIATLERVDVLVSWNFTQIVNLDRIRLFNAVNLKNGYSTLEIRSPREVLHEN